MFVGVVGGGMANAQNAIVLQEFSETYTISGRQAASGDVVYSANSDFVIDDISEPTANAAMWLIKTSTDCFIRVGTDVGGDIGTTTETWYNTGGTSQGDPGTRTGTGTTVFQLGQLPDTVNIYNVNENTTAGSPSWANTPGGTSYTSDDKSTFFAPTTDAKYGRNIFCDALVTGGFDIDIVEGNFDIQFTFRKAGISDYTITFQGHARAQAVSEI